MKKQVIVSSTLAVVCLSLFTALLWLGRLSEVTYLALLLASALISIVVLVLPRLTELDLKNLRMTLAEIRQVKSEVEEVKQNIAEIYGGIDNLRKKPLILDNAKMKELGLGGGLASAFGTMRYTAGCIKRERERLARIFVNAKTPEKIAEAILDSSLDVKVFKWNGPETPLEVEPKPVEQRESDKQKPSQAMEGEK